jgi:DNA-binding transcriptional LysR family regulator
LEQEKALERTGSRRQREVSVAANLPTELLRSFVVIVETGSMIRAADKICVTQSALSLQMKRLSEIVQTPIFERRKRSLVLTPAGDELLTFARGILDLNDRALSSIGRERLAGPARIGVIQDFASAVLSDVLVRFMRRNPEVRLQVKVGDSITLNNQFGAGMLDMVITIGEAVDPTAINTLQMVWCGDSELLKSAELPLAIMNPPCVFRSAALAALDKAGRPYRLVLETPSIAVLRAAVDDGLALTCRTASLLGSTHVMFELPNAPLPKVALFVRTSDSPSPTIHRLSALIRNTLADLEAIQV